MPIIAITGSVFFTLCGTGLFSLITTGSIDGLINFLLFIVVFVIFVGPSVFFYHRETVSLAENAETTIEEI